MDGFTGSKIAAIEEVPDAMAVMDPFRVVRLAFEALYVCQRRVQQQLHGHRGRAGSPLYAVWGVIQAMIAAHRDHDRARGCAAMQALIDTLAQVSPGLVELRRLGRTLKPRAADVLAYFDRPHTSNGPIEATNGRLAHLRGSALGLTQPHQLHRRSLFETGGFRPRLHAQT